MKSNASFTAASVGKGENLWKPHLTYEIVYEIRVCTITHVMSYDVFLACHKSIKHQ